MAGPGIGAGAAATSAGELERLAELVRGARSVVALTGAGISVPSGIPDFRTPRTGLWERVNPMEVAHIGAFREDPVRFWSFYGERFATLGDKQPNGAHVRSSSSKAAACSTPWSRRTSTCCIARPARASSVEVHGTIASCSCPRCGGRVELAQVQSRIAAEEDGVPRCTDCLGPLKPDVVLFGELLSAPVLERARELCERADLLLCVGSSLGSASRRRAAAADARRGWRRGDPHAGTDAARRDRRRAATRRCRSRTAGSARGTRRGLSAQLGSCATLSRYSARTRMLPSSASLASV